MATSIQSFISQKINLPQPSVAATVKLIEEGATIPFISRYRKEATGNLDEVQIESIANERMAFLSLQARKEAIKKAIGDQLNDELSRKIDECYDLIVLEDLYLPFKKKRTTKAAKARAAGLEGLARMIMAQNNEVDERQAQRFTCDEYPSSDEALQGACDIIAEWINENRYVRNKLRSLFKRKALLIAKLKDKSHDKAMDFKDYHQYEERLGKVPSHRLLAVRRGESLGVLSVKIEPDAKEAKSLIEEVIIKGQTNAKIIRKAVSSAYSRLLKPAIETEFANESKEKADRQAILNFARNVEHLLMTAPVGSKRVLAIDPGFRTGCKVVCLDNNGDLLHNETIFPHAPQNKSKAAASKIRTLVESFKIEAIAIGNGTASRETERLIKSIAFKQAVEVFVVNEAGASIYSASKIGREEFPSYDVTVRGAVSIGRRLMDPLSELVKIEPKSLGIGQYQHDVDQTMLAETLASTVEKIVNRVGVNLNTASIYLLQHVSGLGPKNAQKIIEYRSEKGLISSRAELLKVPSIGQKTFEQCAGFVRIPNATNPLDNTRIHPERYRLVEKMAKASKVEVKDVIGNKDLASSIPIEKYVSDEVGLKTLEDIRSELIKPFPDHRKKAEVFEFDPKIRTLEDLSIGYVLNGIVTNVTKFGAFVNIGIKQNGLIHISQIKAGYVADPGDELRLDQHVRAKVVSLDPQTQRIGLSLIDVEQPQ